MLKSKVQAFLSAAVLCMLVVAGCNENDSPVDPGGTGTTPLAPVGLMANSASATSVNLMWTAPSATSDVSSYQLIVTPTGGTAMAPVTIAKTSTTHTVTGLTEGTTYTFSLRAQGTGTNMSTASTVTWAPARRYSVRLYETTSDQPSGVDLSTGLTSTLSGASNWDLALDTRNNSWDIGSPNLTSYTITSPRTTLVSNAYSSANYTSLDQLFDTQAQMPTVAQLVNFNSVNDGFIFLAKTVEGNYAKVLVKSTGGKILQGNSPDRYVDLDISYQSAVNVPYFIPGVPVGNEVKTLTSKSQRKAD